MLSDRLDQVHRITPHHWPHRMKPAKFRQIFMKRAICRRRLLAGTGIDRAAIARRHGHVLEHERDIAKPLDLRWVSR